MKDKCRENLVTRYKLRFSIYIEYDSKSLFNVKAYQYVSKAHDYYFDVKSTIIAHLLLGRPQIVSAPTVPQQFDIFHF